MSRHRITIAMSCVVLALAVALFVISSWQDRCEPATQPAQIPAFLDMEIESVRVEPHGGSEGKRLPSELSEEQLRTLVKHMKAGTPYPARNLGQLFSDGTRRDVDIMQVAVGDTNAWGEIIFKSSRGEHTVYFWNDSYVMLEIRLDGPIVGNRIQCPGIGPLISSMAKKDAAEAK